RGVTDVPSPARGSGPASRSGAAGTDHPSLRGDTPRRGARRLTQLLTPVRPRMAHRIARRRPATPVRLREQGTTRWVDIRPLGAARAVSGPTGPIWRYQRVLSGGDGPRVELAGDERPTRAKHPQQPVQHALILEHDMGRASVRWPLRHTFA